jgi:hypothetical protein
MLFLSMYTDRFLLGQRPLAGDAAALKHTVRSGKEAEAEIKGGGKVQGIKGDEGSKGTQPILFGAEIA